MAGKTIQLGGMGGQTPGADGEPGQSMGGGQGDEGGKGGNIALMLDPENVCGKAIARGIRERYTAMLSYHVPTPTRVWGPHLLAMASDLETLAVLYEQDPNAIANAVRKAGGK